jgi:hypothetical protein
MLFEPLKIPSKVKTSNLRLGIFRGEFHFRKTQLFFATFFFCEKKKVEYNNRKYQQKTNNIP